MIIIIIIMNNIITIIIIITTTTVFSLGFCFGESQGHLKGTKWACTRNDLLLEAPTWSNMVDGVFAIW